MLDAPECPNCRRLAAEIERLNARVAALEEECRRGKRQAGPFSKDRPKPNPKPPGRKPGHAPAFRPAPPPETVTETIPVPLTTCPRCGTPIQEVTDNPPIFQTDLPPIKPIVQRFDTQRGFCPCCRKRVHSRHPDQTSTATGAAGSAIGPRAKALAADFKHRLGLSFRKIAEIFQTHFGITLTPGAIVQSNERLAERAAAAYADLQRQAQESPAVHVDETGWRISTRSAWLWVVATKALTFYLIRPSRGHEVVEEVLGKRFAGVLASDGLPTYDVVDARWKQTCLAHLLRRCAELAATKVRGAVRFPRTVADLLRRAMALRSRRPALTARGVAIARGRIEAALDRLLAYTRTDPDNERLAAHVYKHRAHLFTFLDHPEVDPTNNLAERQIRPAVIARKLSAGNRTDRGAETHAVLASLAATCRQRRERFTAFAQRLLRLPPSTPPLLLASVPLPP
jgi:transposase